MKKPAAILVLQYWYYQYLPVSAILVQILVNTSIPVSSRIFQYLQYQALPKYEYCRYWKILENTGNTSIADTGRFWKILVIPVLQILENTGNTSIADTGRLGMKLRNVLLYWGFFQHRKIVTYAITVHGLCSYCQPSYSFQHRSFKLCRMFVHIMKVCISQNDTRQEI